MARILSPTGLKNASVSLASARKWSSYIGLKAAERARAFFVRPAIRPALRQPCFLTPLYQGGNRLFDEALELGQQSAPSAPSTTRWSQDNVAVIWLMNLTPPSSVSIGARRVAPTARMVACGGLMIAANSRTPYMPRLEMALEPPWYSFGLELFLVRARSARSRISAEIAVSVFVSGAVDHRRDQPAVERHCHCRCRNA